MRINHRQIEAFRAVILAGSVTRAAELLGISQPATSRLLRDLRHGLGLKLFQKAGTGLEPTAAAVTLYTEVERSFVGLERIARTAESLRDARAGSLRIAGLPALMNGYLPRFCGRYLAGRPDLHMALQGLISPRVVEAVLGNQVDLGFTELPVRSAGLVSRAMPSLPRVVALPAGHRLAAREVIALADLDGEDFIALTPSSTGRAEIDLAFAAQGAEMVVRAETTLSEIACGMVSSGLGVAICDPFTAREFAGRGVVARPLRPVVGFSFQAIFPPQRAPLPIATEFVESLARTIAADFADEVAA